MRQQPGQTHALTSRLPTLYYGGDYNPEQWMPSSGYMDEAIWQEDIRLMHLARVNLVSIGIFSWVSLQPDEQTYTFDWLDRVMDLLADNGIFACLATGTAAQPAWLSQAYPDVLPVTAQRVRRGHGERVNYCPTSPDFRRLGQNLVRHLAERYRAHPALLLWHVSNEYGTYCYCERCSAHFRAWLQARYGSLEEVNRRWNTTFWSHTYASWEQIIPPGPLTEQSVQGLMLDYQRFLSDVNLECYRGEADILHTITPDVPVTTNFMGTYKPLDYFSWAPYLDVISWDSYPQPNDHPSEIAFRHELMRGLKQGQPWLLMEQTPSQIQWAPYNPLKRPGVMRLYSYQALAHGADAIMFFQWRQSRGSAEKYHGAIVSHAGHEQTRVFDEVATLGRELTKIGEKIAGTRLSARVALVFSWPNWWNVEYLPGPSSALSYLDEVQSYYRSLWEKNVPVDVIAPDQDLSGYDLVIAPLLNMVTAEQGAAIERYVEAGGTFVTSYFSGVVDENDLAWLGGYPGPLRKTLGIWVEEFDPLLLGSTNRVLVSEDQKIPAGSYTCERWCDLIHLEGAQALATYEEDFYAGRPAITENRLGAGRALYVATRPAQQLLDALISSLLTDLALTPSLSAPEGVEITSRTDSEHIYTFVLNHNTHVCQLDLAEPMQDMLTGETCTGRLNLPARGVAIFISA